jgi:hypothetical protein
MNGCKWVVAAIGAVFIVALSAWADDLKDDAVARLVAIHEPDVPVAVGRLAVKQAGLVAARSLLARRGREAGLDRGWNALAPEWQEAETRIAGTIDALIVRRIEDPAWVRAILTEQFARTLNGEEADEIATHFASGIGREQRIVIEVKVVGELLLANYTFTSRIDDTVRGSESEYARMQKVWSDREPFRVRNFDGDAGAQRFGTRNPGIKYVKMLAMQGVEGMIRHIDAVRDEAAEAVAAADIDVYIDAYRARSAK